MSDDKKAAIFAEVKASLGGFPFVQNEVAAIDAMIARRNLIPEVEVPEGTPKSLHNEVAFYDAVRKICNGLDTIQVNTIKGLIAGASHWPIFHIAYGFATAYWEAKFRPIEEIGKGRGKRYGKPMKYHQAPYGRGLVQLTWDDNYEWADKVCSEAGLIKKGEILNDFSLVMRPDIAAYILVKGMEDGAFAKDKEGKPYSLSRMIKTGTMDEFLEARRIINGTDRKVEIANLAVRFMAAFNAGGWS